MTYTPVITANVSVKNSTTQALGGCVFRGCFSLLGRGPVDQEAAGPLGL